MTLNAKIVFNDFLGDFGLRDTFQKRIAPKPIEIDMEKLHTKFSALNVNFDGPSLDFSKLKKTCARRHQSVVPPQKWLFYRCYPVFRENVSR